MVGYTVENVRTFIIHDLDALREETILRQNRIICTSNVNKKTPTEKVEVLKFGGGRLLESN